MRRASRSSSSGNSDNSPPLIGEELSLHANLPNTQWDEFVARNLVKKGLLNKDEKIPNPDPMVLNDDILNYAYALVLDKNNETLLSNLKPGQGHYFKRPVTARFQKDAPERSIAVLRNLQGEYELIIDYKSKTEGNLKISINWPKGSYKKWKVCTRIDVSPFISKRSGILFNSRGKFKSLITPEKLLDKGIDADEREFLKELAETNLLHNICPRHFPTVASFIDQDGNMRLYADHLGKDLYDTLYNKVSTDLNLDNSLIKLNLLQIEAWKLDLMYQLVQAIVALEKASTNHNDLKSANIMCAYRKNPQDKHGRFYLKIIDPMPSKFHEIIGAYGTSEYWQPQTFMSAIGKLLEQPYGLAVAKTSIAKFEKECGDTLAITLVQKALSRIDKMADPPNQENLAKQQEAIQKFCKIDNSMYAGKADIWATGIICYELLFRKYPKYKDFFPVPDPKIPGILKKLLDPTPNRRIAASDLLKEMDNMPAFADAKDHYLAAETTAEEVMPNTWTMDQSIPLELRQWSAGEVPNLDFKDIQELCSVYLDKNWANEQLKNHGVDIQKWQIYLKSLEAINNDTTLKGTEKIPKARDIFKAMDANAEIIDKFMEQELYQYAAKNSLSENEYADVHKLKCVLTLIHAVFMIWLLRQRTLTQNDYNILMKETIPDKIDFDHSIQILSFYQLHGTRQDKYGMKP